MKLQVAIDRVPLDKAIMLAHKLDGIADIIELGTSLIKDYGFYTINDSGLKLKSSKLLLDIKTNDEGSYEFERGYSTGADILTVMGSSNSTTLEEVYNIAKSMNKQVLIDLMGLSIDEISKISNFQDAIYNIHIPHDIGKASNITDTVAMFKKTFPTINNIAVAGGIDLNQAVALSNQNISNIAIVGGSIVKNADPVSTAIKFKEAIK